MRKVCWCVLFVLVALSYVSKCNCSINQQLLRTDITYMKCNDTHCCSRLCQEKFKQKDEAEDNKVTGNAEAQFQYVWDKFLDDKGKLLSELELEPLTFGTSLRVVAVGNRSVV